MLHAGSLVAALASWLDARHHHGVWLVRIEDIDTPRCVKGAAQGILQQLARCALLPDAQPLYQSKQSIEYQRALDQLIHQNAAYHCTCSRQDIANKLSALGIQTPKGQEAVYPGTCRPTAPTAPTAPSHNPTLPQHSDHAWRFVTHGSVAQGTGDFVLRRKDGLWAYQLAVVVDDAAQGITHIVRGQDLLDNTARQVQLQQALGYPTPIYLHTPLVLAADGLKLSKQNGAQPLQLDTEQDALLALNHAAQVLGLPTTGDEELPNRSLSDQLRTWVRAWGELRRDYVYDSEY